MVKATIPEDEHAERTQSLVEMVAWLTNSKRFAPAPSGPNRASGHLWSFRHGLHGTPVVSEAVVIPRPD